MTWYNVYVNYRNIRTFAKQQEVVRIFNLSNARTFAVNASIAQDVESVDIVDGTTGEVMSTFADGLATYTAN